MAPFPYETKNQRARLSGSISLREMEVTVVENLSYLFDQRERRIKSKKNRDSLRNKSKEDFKNGPINRESGARYGALDSTRKRKMANVC